jgi:hypothetical protein
MPDVELLRAAGLRRQAFLASAALIVEFLLGVIVNLCVTVPRAGGGPGIGPAIGRAVGSGPAALAIRAVVGLLLIVAAVALTARSGAARLRLVASAAAVALLCVIGASASGASFADRAKPGASMTMAVLTGVALLCYVAIIYALPRPQNKIRSEIPAPVATTAEGD